MSIAKVTTFWNAFIAVLVKCVAALGTTVTSRAANAATPRPAATEAAEPTRRNLLATIPSPRSFEPLPDRTLPPTMKQRIRAERHGSSPATRSLPGDPGDPTDSPAPTVAA
ncbi:DUF6344 domain-containing protein [Streptomyces sp. NPDC059373]